MYNWPCSLSTGSSGSLKGFILSIISGRGDSVPGSFFWIFTSFVVPFTFLDSRAYNYNNTIADLVLVHFDVTFFSSVIFLHLLFFLLVALHNNTQVCRAWSMQLQSWQVEQTMSFHSCKQQQILQLYGVTVCNHRCHKWNKLNKKGCYWMVWLHCASEAGEP